MTNLSDKVTVFVITTDKSVNYEECIKALKAQTVLFDIIVIKNFHPMPKAFQQMIERCETPYYAQVDDDMILYPNAIEKMYEAIIQSPKLVSMVAFMLKDIHLNFEISGVKIYKHQIFKKYPYKLSCLSCEVEQTNRMVKDGYYITTVQEVVGDHSPKWTNEAIFERYYNLMEKFKEFKYGWLENLPQKLWEILKSNPTQQNLFAVLGAYTSIIKKGIEHKERDFMEDKRPEFQKMNLFINPQFNKKLNIVKVVDQFGWAYYFLDREQQKYSKHNIIIQRMDKVDLSGADILYLHGPTVLNSNFMDVIKKNNIKIIGAYGGELLNFNYQNVDALVTISPKSFEHFKKNSQYSTVFLPEGIDTNFFLPDKFHEDRFVVGYAGSKIPLKRTHLFDKLSFPVSIKSDWSPKYFVEQDQSHMVEFYKTIDVLILLSNTECMPRVVLESMAMGKAIIATKVGCLDMILEKEWLIDVNPEEEVIKQANEKLTYLSNHPEVRRKVGIRNREFVEKCLSWKVTQPLWDDFFDKVYLGDNQSIVNFPNYMDNFKK